MTAFFRYGWIILIVLWPALAYAECPDDVAVGTFVADYTAHRTSKALSNDITLADAECARAKVMKALSKTLGPVNGYKMAFTSPEQQQRVKATRPGWGYMYAKPLMQSGAMVSTKIGTAIRFEGDFLVVAKDAGLADAKTPLEALRHVAAIIPFIELPDVALLEGQSTGNGLVATTLGFRSGVMGPRVPVEATQAFLDKLTTMDVVLTEDKSGKELGRVKGSAVLNGDPISAAMWLAQELKKSGVKLKRGDVLSLGSYHAPAAIKPGTTITLKYVGLPGDPSVTANFE